jgi:thiazole/oxazole-forming peptide maturase SagD family component
VSERIADLVRHIWPRATRYGFVRRGQLVLLGATDEIVVASLVKETQRVLRECTGYSPIHEVRARVRTIDDATFHAVIEAGLENGYIQDSRRLFEDFHSDSVRHLHEYDPDLVSDLLGASRELSLPGVPIASTDVAAEQLRRSGLFEVLSKRRTVRSFGLQRIPDSTLMAMLRCLYWIGPGPRPTPSAGGLYSIEIYLATVDGIQTARPSVQRFDPLQGTLHELDQNLSPEALARVLDCADPPNGYVVFVVAAMDRIWSKYSNRAYRLALLEAGHLAQNAYLFGAESGVGVLEYAGVDERALRPLLGLVYPRQVLLTTLVVGYESSEVSSPFSNRLLDLLHQLKTSLVGPEKPIEWVQMVQFGSPPYEFQRVAATCDYRDPKGSAKPAKSIERRCQATSTSSAEAAIKAIAEGYERHVSGLVRWDAVSSADQFDASEQSWVDPREYAPYTRRHHQGALRHLEPFDPSRVWQWRHGTRLLTRERTEVPVDLVFYPLRKADVGRALCYEATSSGVAADTETDGAVRRALFELIERDAICVTWYCRRAVTAIPTDTLGLDVSTRVRRWLNLGWQVRCLNITTDSVPVVLAIIYSADRRPHFVSGAAAATTFQEAAKKALDEAEVMLSARRLAKPRRKPETRVRSPLDHGMMYFERESLDKVRWLIDAPPVEASAQTIPLQELVERYDPVSVELATAGVDGPLSVVRLLSKRLIPISFGFGSEHFRHPRADALGLKWRRSYPASPHFFA